MPTSVRSRLIRPGTIDVPSFLEAQGVQNISPGGAEVAFSCPFPGHLNGDHRPSARMNASTTAWYCHGCKRHGNAITFAAELQGVTNHVAWGWLTKAYGDRLLDTSPDDFVDELDKILVEEALEVDDVVCFPALSAHEMRFVSVQGYKHWDHSVAIYMAERGISIVTAFNFGIHCDNSTKRLVLEIRDELGRLVGWKGRRVSNETPGPKYLIYEPVYPASDYVYLMHRVVPNERGEIIVCEGEMNALKMQQLGWENAVGLPGSHMSPRQAGLIASKADTAILIFDSDEAGIRGAVEATNLLDPYMNVKIVPGHEGDPDRMTVPEIAWLLDEAKTRLEWELE